MTRLSDPSRRDALQTLIGSAALAASGSWLLACSTDGGVDDTASSSDDTGDGLDTVDSGVDSDDPLTGWATGGTAAMTAAASYPNPWTTGLADDSCALTCTLTLGPCYAPTAPVRQDVSEGEAGLPLRLMLRVVEADGCTAVEGAEVEIWHCNLGGVYSGDDVESGEFCTGGDTDAIQSYFFRGRAMTGADGVATFDTTFPGWYSSRAVHIHLLVRRAADAGEAGESGAKVISQVFFPEALVASIFAEVEGYTTRGQPDTTFATDTVLREVADPTPYVADYAQMPDGAMLAWKTIAISDSERC